MLIIKLLIILLLLFIIFNLFRAGFIMLRNTPSEEVKMSRYLGRRVLLSVAILLLLVLALASGLLSQHPRPY